MGNMSIHTHYYIQGCFQMKNKLSKQLLVPVLWFPMLILLHNPILHALYFHLATYW